MTISDLLFPKKCLECGALASYICPSCLGKCGFCKPICPFCERASIDGMTHTKCQRKFGLDGLISLWSYEGVVRKAIVSLKYRFATDVANELVEAALKVLKTHDSSFLIHNSWLLVPVPLHWYRQNFRGFNQSEEIGKLVAGKMGWKFVPDFLLRKKSTIPQAQLKGEERKQNLKDVFSINPDYVLTTKYSALLFDDVSTTGSTLKEAAKVLKRAGIEKVWGLTIAR